MRLRVDLRAVGVRRVLHPPTTTHGLKDPGLLTHCPLWGQCAETEGGRWPAVGAAGP